MTPGRLPRATIAYTNHTVMPEALERWPIDLFRHLLPRVYMIVEEIDRRYRETADRTKPNWQDVLKSTAILWDGQVRMANLAVISSFSVNGRLENPYGDPEKRYTPGLLCADAAEILEYD